MKVFVYRNLHKNCWSVKCLKTRRVVAHVDSIVLRGAMGKVSQAGRERVLREKRKNVHAGILGHWDKSGTVENLSGLSRPITYNPYKYSSFVYSDTCEPIETCDTIVLTNNGKVREVQDA